MSNLFFRRKQNQSKACLFQYKKGVSHIAREGLANMFSYTSSSVVTPCANNRFVSGKSRKSNETNRTLHPRIEHVCDRSKLANLLLLLITKPITVRNAVITISSLLCRLIHFYLIDATCAFRHSLGERCEMIIFESHLSN